MTISMILAVAFSIGLFLPPAESDFFPLHPEGRSENRVQSLRGNRTAGDLYGIYDHHRQNEGYPARLYVPRRRA